MQNLPNLAKVDALEIKYALPGAVVLKPMPPGFTQRFSDSGAVWFCAEPSQQMESGNTDTSPDWQARCGDVIAVPAKPNTGNSQLTTLAGISCLAFRSQVNCGYCIPEAIIGGGPFSLAVIYAHSIEQEPRSLVTINPVNADNYLFLSERDNTIELTDQQGSFSLQQPVKQECYGFRLVIFSRTNEGYALALNEQDIRREIGPVENLEDNKTRHDASKISDLFIGCRSHRKGILKTLGEHMLADVFLWPDKDVLGAKTSPEYDLLLKYYTEIICRGV